MVLVAELGTDSLFLSFVLPFIFSSFFFPIHFFFILLFCLFSWHCSRIRYVGIYIYIAMRIPRMHHDPIVGPDFDRSPFTGVRS